MRSMRFGVFVMSTALLVGGGLATGAGDGSLKQVSDQKQVQYPTPKTATATCPGAKGRIASGGWKTNNNPPGLGPDVYPYEFYPTGSDADRFAVRGHNRFAAEQATLTAYGYCFNGKKPTIRKSDPVNVPAYPNGEVSVSVDCRSKTLLGGGFRVYPHVDPQSIIHVEGLTRPLSSERYDVTIVSTKDDAVNLVGYAVCGAGKRPKEYSKSTTIKSGKEGSVTAKCPSNKDFVFGGLYADYEYVSDDAALIKSFQRSGNGMKASALVPLSSDDSSVKVTAFCR